MAIICGAKSAAHACAGGGGTFVFAASYGLELPIIAAGERQQIVGMLTCGTAMAGLCSRPVVGAAQAGWWLHLTVRNEHCRRRRSWGIGVWSSWGIGV